MYPGDRLPPVKYGPRLSRGRPAGPELKVQNAPRGPETGPGPPKVQTEAKWAAHTVLEPNSACEKRRLAS
jgi:hypothetical protein